MGKKYIIEIIGGKEGDMDFSTIEPYTEPDLEQVRMEAYEDGYKTAKVQCNIQAEKDLREVGERHYQKGLSDAWEAARKICTNWVLSDSVLSEIFGMDKTIDDIMKESTASEAIEKIRQYEQEGQIQVGDEVQSNGDTLGVVTRLYGDGVYVTWSDGTSGLHVEDRFAKTGRHFPEIAEVLRKMGETNNG